MGDCSGHFHISWEQWIKHLKSNWLFSKVGLVVGNLLDSY